MSEEKDDCVSAGCWSESFHPYSQPGTEPRPRLWLWSWPGAAPAGRSRIGNVPASVPCRRTRVLRQQAVEHLLKTVTAVLFFPPLPAQVTQPVALSHTVAGGKIHSWNMGNKEIQRRSRAGNGKVLPCRKALVCWKSLTHAKKCIFLVLRPFLSHSLRVTLTYTMYDVRDMCTIASTANSESGIYVVLVLASFCFSHCEGKPAENAAEVLLTNYGN